ncbi:MAG: hypothetical protein HC866_23900 [Leptolyngbyaceae cyanobacterium RU_5_1]|nr:hypothetical protein [Leptolyngbyaceae cyanobacterium RU_5_1]
MNNRIQSQVNKLWQVISSPATAATYQQTLTLTWTILKETGQLLWLVLCLGLVAGDWFWKKSYHTGQDTRTWISTVQSKAESRAEHGEEAASTSTFLSETLTETGKSLLSAGQTGVALALSTAKGQLGIEEQSKPQPQPAKVSAAPTQASGAPKASVPDAKPAGEPESPQTETAAVKPMSPAGQEAG